MRIAGLAFLGMVLLPCAAWADPAIPFITVTGEGTVAAVPDQARITVGVVSEAPTAAAALTANREAMNGVFAALKKLGIEDRAIRTSNFSLQPQYPPVVLGQPVQRREIIGYSVNNQVAVTLDDVSRVGAVLDALVAAGANQTGGVTFTIRDQQPLQAAARTAAIKDARARAEADATTAGVMLGPIQSIADGATRVAVAGSAVAPRFEAAPPPPTPIGAGEQDVTASVTITWAIK